MTLSNKNKYLAADVSTYIWDQKLKNEIKQKLPRKRDIVVIKSHVINN